MEYWKLTARWLGIYGVALDWFNPGDEVVVESGKIIRDWWSFQYDSWDQGSWAYLFSAGLVAEDEALSWRDMVWQSSIGDELTMSRFR